MNRRGFLTACLATCTAPAIVRASSLMPISAILKYDAYFIQKMAESQIAFERNLNWDLYSDDFDIDLSRVTRQSYIPKLKAQVYSASHVSWWPGMFK